VPGDGKPIVLLRESQVTGGYAKIAVVARVEMDFLGQVMPGNIIRFQRIDRKTALELLREEAVRLGTLRHLIQ
jgi:allophanate hydrolase subunit 2